MNSFKGSFIMSNAIALTTRLNAYLETVMQENPGVFLSKESIPLRALISDETAKMIYFAAAKDSDMDMDTFMKKRAFRFGKIKPRLEISDTGIPYGCFEIVATIPVTEPVDVEVHEVAEEDMPTPTMDGMIEGTPVEIQGSESEA